MTPRAGDPLERPDLNAALEAFEATEANLVRLENIRAEMLELIPSGIAFIENGPEGRRYQELRWAYDEVVAALPEISGFRVNATPLGLDAMAQWRLDAAEIGESQAELELDEEIVKPDRQVAEYRHQFEKERRDLVRDALTALVAEINVTVTSLVGRIPPGTDGIDDEEWDRLQTLTAQLDRLVGGQLPKSKSWSDLYRHLRFGQGQDLHDIARTDWPAVRHAVQQGLYSDYEPVPVGVRDLSALAANKPTGPVTTALMWERIGDEEFERLIFNLISETEGYQNAQWLTRTNAPDRGRDLSVERVRSDALTGQLRKG